VQANFLESWASLYRARSGARFEGFDRRHVDLVSGRFALIEKSREVTLVPWRPIIHRDLGKAVSGVMRGAAISWTLGRQRGGPTMLARAMMDMVSGVFARCGDERLPCR
jgi:hypothetical protein